MFSTILFFLSSPFGTESDMDLDLFVKSSLTWLHQIMFKLLIIALGAYQGGGGTIQAQPHFFDLFRVFCAFHLSGDPISPSFFSLTKIFTIIYLGRINMFSQLFEMSDIASNICEDLC